MHMIGSYSLLTNVKKIDAVTVALPNERKIKCEKSGSVRTKTNDDQGNEIDLELKDVLFVPSLKVNLVGLRKPESGKHVDCSCSIRQKRVSFEQTRRSWKRPWKQVCLEPGPCPT